MSSINSTTITNLLVRYNDVMLAFLVVAIISLMILPLPPVVVDALLATNLGISVALLMLALYIPNPLSLSTFPSLLLFTTMFRLALTITTTRQILLYAFAGNIIETFGKMVVAGNFIVGVVVFLIITIVQFLVIAKGAERVSEVGARFTLDALPGKQMSIDADLRSGGIDIDEARNRRNLLAKESQLYGAMDGAMKFVKGDSIAGLIVVAVNILAGMAIGVTQKGMTIGEALQRYSVLTVGDGLVSQIPALFISITAGIIVTRVSGGVDTPALGAEIGEQVLGEPKALIIAGGILGSFSLIPGFPKAPFLLLGLFVVSAGYLFGPLARKKEAEKGDIPALGSAAGKSKTTAKKGEDKVAAQEFALTVPLLLDADASIQDAVKPKVLNEELLKIRQALYMDLGVPFPGIHLRFSEHKQEGEYNIYLHEIPIAQGLLNKGHLFVREAPENLEILGIPFVTDSQFLPHTTKSIWVAESLREKLEEVDLPFMDVPKILTYHLSYVLKKHAAEFVGLQETRYLLDKMETNYPELVKEVQRIVPLQKINDVLQRLVTEEISIRNLRVIFQNMIEWGQKEKDTILLTEYIRIGLSRYISYKFSGGMNMLPVYLLDPEVEELVRGAVRQTSAGSYLALDPESGQALIAEAKKIIGEIDDTKQTPAILTSMDIRRYLKKLIESELPEIPVLSHQEMSQDINIQPLGKIEL